MKMNYTKTIREYCLQNKGDIFDVSYMKDTYFEMVPYKTLLKILNRLEEENILTGIAKGEYLINAEGASIDSAIIRRYISDDHGMYAGQAMFRELWITMHKTEVVEIYTNHLNVEHKSIGNYQLTRVDVPFTDRIVPLIQLLDCIEKGHTVVDGSIIRLQEVINELTEQYTDGGFYSLIRKKDYRYSTIVTLSELLNNKGIENRCIEFYKGACDKQ